MEVTKIITSFQNYSCKELPRLLYSHIMCKKSGLLKSTYNINKGEGLGWLSQSKMRDYYLQYCACSSNFTCY